MKYGSYIPVVRLASITFFILLLSLKSFAQFSVSGKVLNAADTKPVANVSVFLNNTTIGDKTANDGGFMLRSLKPGKYKLVISIIGFDTYDQTIAIGNKDIVLPDISIIPKAIALNEVTIKPVTDAYRNIYYDKFKNEFLGTSDAARDCSIINPEILDFNYDDASGDLTASSGDFLVIDNPALGYRLKYLLKNFTFNDKNFFNRKVHYEGSVLFTEMTGTVAQQRRWQQKRQEIYEASAMHFLRSAVNNSLDEDGFRVFRLAKHANPDRPSDSLVQAKIKQFDVARDDRKDKENRDSLAFWQKKAKLLKLPKIVRELTPFPLNSGDIIANTPQPGIFMLGCDSDALLIMYDKNRHFPAIKTLQNLNTLTYLLNKPGNDEFTLLSFSDPFAFFDRQGGIINPNSLVFSGAWVKNRVGDLLPADYEPPADEKSTTAMLLKNDTLLSSAVVKLNTFSAKNPAEKVYLHLDKPHYAIGDTLWFKAYTVIGEQHQLSALSGILYVELINPKDSVIKRLTLPLTAGIAWGDFSILRAYKPGGYHIRAYTNWMRNAGAGYFYNQRIQVGGLQLSLTEAKQIEASNPDVQFFPEGGQLVNGVRSRIAIKAVNSDGLGMDIKGTIEDNQGNIVADFATQHLGMGVFALTPQSGKTYKAKIKGAGESGFTVDLPPAMDEGFTLALNNTRPDSIYIKVAANEKTFNEQKNSIFYIIAQTAGKVYYTAEGKLDGLIYAAKVDKGRFPSGIAQFTLFSQNGEPLAERVAFIQSNDTLKLDLSAPSATYNTRQPVKIEISAKDNSNLPATGSFSVAVINESRVGIDEDAESTILNNLLLTSDLKGYIEQPNYYFANENDQTKADLDVLMLTQGYRRFDWKQVLNNTNETIAYRPERSLELSGTLKTPSGKPVPNGKVTLVATKQNVLRDTTTDINGNFTFTGLYLPDTAKLVLRARKEHNGSNVAIYVRQPDYPAVAKKGLADVMPGLSPETAAVMQKDYADYEQQKRVDSLKNGIMLKQVTVKGREMAKADMYNNYGAVLEYDVDMNKLSPEYFKIEDALTLVIPGLEGLNHHYFYEKRPVKFIIDGFPRKADDLNFFQPKEVESIRMISGTGLSLPTLILTTKRYAGTDITSPVKLKQVNIQAKKINKGPDLSRSSNLHGGGDADQVIMGDKVDGCITISDCLIGKIFGVKFNADGTPVNLRSHQKMSIIVDGIVLDGNHLNDLNGSDIYSIEVLRTGAARAIYGTSIQNRRENGGALVITMKNGSESSKDLSKDTTVLKQVDVTASKISDKPELTHSDNLNGPGNANQVIMGDKLEGCITLSDCLKARIFGVTFDKNNVPHSIRTGARLGEFEGYPPPPMVIIVDGNIMDARNLNTLNADDIYSIEVLRSRSYLAIYGSNAPGGALVITTKRGDENHYITSETPAGVITYPFNGFYKARTFYSPKYSVSKTDVQNPDMRNTIYWSPNIITDKEGKASFEYFNNDTRGVYRIVVEGIDASGNLGRQVYRYKVE